MNKRSNLQSLLDSDQLFLQYVGGPTDLIFNQGFDMPGFASYPLLETDVGRTALLKLIQQLIDMARQVGVGVILDTETWVANRDRGSAIGYSPEKLREINLASVDLIAGLQEKNKDVLTILSAQMGPRGDGYQVGDQMSVEEAEAYHTEQMKTLSRTKADIISAFTLTYPAEAAGIVRAGQNCEMQVAIAFTVETDGRLPNGMTLEEAITMVDEETDGGAAYFLINCAHPDHFSDSLTNEPWIERIRGVVVNASRCSHAELDEAEELDDGNPEELGVLVGNIRQRFPHFNIVGGCCGTDVRHMRSIAENAKVSAA